MWRGSSRGCRRLPGSLEADRRPQTDFEVDDVRVAGELLRDRSTLEFSSELGPVPTAVISGVVLRIVKCLPGFGLELARFRTGPTFESGARSYRSLHRFEATVRSGAISSAVLDESQRQKEPVNLEGTELVELRQSYRTGCGLTTADELTG